MSLKPKELILPEVSPDIRLGDYVLASTWGDCDPFDPWRVGFVCQLVYTWTKSIKHIRASYIIGEADGTWTDTRQYRHARRITAKFGQKWLAAHSKRNY